MAEPELSTEEAKALVGAIAQLTRMAGRVLPEVQHPLVDRVQAHLGGPMTVVPNSSLSLPPIEHANLQVAMNVLEAQADAWEVIGL